MNFLILSDCRCGGNALRSALNQHPCLWVGDELLNPVQIGFKFPTDLRQWITDTFDELDGFHLQRYQIPADRELWECVLRPDLRVIDLRRRDMHAQYCSWKVAMATNEWLDRPADMLFPSLPWDQEDFERTCKEWELGRAFTDLVFADTPRLRVDYEELDHNLSRTLEKVQRFLRVSYEPLEPDFAKPSKINYGSIFSAEPFTRD